MVKCAFFVATDGNNNCKEQEEEKKKWTTNLDIGQRDNGVRGLRDARSHYCWDGHLELAVVLRYLFHEFLSVRKH